MKKIYFKEYNSNYKLLVEDIDMKLNEKNPDVEKFELLTIYNQYILDEYTRKYSEQMVIFSNEEDIQQAKHILKEHLEQSLHKQSILHIGRFVVCLFSGFNSFIFIESHLSHLVIFVLIISILLTNPRSILFKT